jgi:hypothetical protein
MVAKIKWKTSPPAKARHHRASHVVGHLTSSVKLIRLTIPLELVKNRAGTKPKHLFPAKDFAF